MKKFKISAIFHAVDAMSRPIRAINRVMGRFNTRMRGVAGGMKRLNAAGKRAGSAFRGMGAGIAAGMASFAAVDVVKNVAALDRRLERLGVQAGVSSDGMKALRDEIFSVANAPDIRIDPSELLAAIESVVTKTGDLKFAQDNIRNLGLAIQASGSQGAEMGKVVSEFHKFGIVLKKDVLSALDILIKQGKSGAFELKDLADQSERTVSAMAAMGFRGMEAVRAMGSLLQLARSGTGSAEEAATAFENLIKNIVTKAEKLHSIEGITIFDPEKLKQGLEVFRPLNEIVTDIIRKTRGRSTVLTKLFDIRAMRAVNVLAAEFKDTGFLPSLEKYYKINGDGAELTKDSARIAGDFTASLRSLKTAFDAFASKNLAGPLQAVADTLNNLSPLQVQTLTASVGLLAGVIGSKLVWALGVATAAFVATPFGFIVTGISAVIAGGYLLVKNWDKISAAFKKIWAGIKDSVTDAINAVKFKINNFVNRLPGGLRSLLGLSGFSRSLVVEQRGGAASATSPIALGPRQGKADVTVKFENAPPGMRVVDQTAQDVDLSVDTGISFAGAGS